LAKNDNCLNLVTIGSIGRVPDIIMPFKDRVFNLGPIKDHFKLAEIYAASDCFVLPSYQDNFPCTILESLCTGTPVVVYNTGGISEMLVHHPKAGIVVLNRDPISLHEAINNLLRNGITSRERKEIRGSTIKKYSISHFIDKHIKLYERVLLAK
jgi:glycosyltransferase involved in cell wall biosynthesis